MAKFSHPAVRAGLSTFAIVVAASPALSVKKPIISDVPPPLVTPVSAKAQSYVTWHNANDASPVINTHVGLYDWRGPDAHLSEDSIPNQGSARVVSHLDVSTHYTGPASGSFQFDAFRSGTFSDPADRPALRAGYTGNWTYDANLSAGALFTLGYSMTGTEAIDPHVGTLTIRNRSSRGQVDFEWLTGSGTTSISLAPGAYELRL